MTIPYERTRSLIETKSFLHELQDPKLTPRVPAIVREIARKLLRHYPGLLDIELAHTALPHLYGPVPPFSRLAGGEQTVGVIEAARKQQAGLKQMIEASERMGLYDDLSSLPDRKRGQK
jgi:hypothetical protein